MKIKNEFGENISSIFLIDKKEFRSPHYFIDTLEPKEKDPKITTTTDSKILRDIDFVIYMKSVTRKIAWIRGQKYRLFLKPLEEDKEPGSKKINKLPEGHEFEIDESNCKIRIVGPYSSPSWKGEWIYY